MERFILRDELFGGTLYDRDRLLHKFLLKEEIRDKIDFNGVDVKNFEKWNIDLSKAPSGIIYSPLRVYFEMTLRCNLRCKTCFNSAGAKSPNEMNTEEVKKCLEGLRRDNVFDIRFTGGEVTQREDWFEILNYAKEKGFALSINTNGVYNDKKILDQLVSLDLDQITISLDGAEKTNDYLRGKGAFQKATSSLKYLYSHGAKTRINTVLTKPALEDFREILKIANQYCNEINFFYMRTAGRALDILDSVVSPKNLDRFESEIKKEKIKYPNLRVLHGSQVMVRNSILDAKYGLNIGGPDGFTRMNLESDGSVYAGGYAPYLGFDLNLGNLKDENYSILNIWRNSEKLNSFRKKSLNLQQICGSCEDHLSGFCPGASMEMELFRKANPEIGNPYCSKPNRTVNLLD